MESADIHGVIASVSPMKKGKRASYFDCKLTDGEVQMRVVGFRNGQQKKLASFMEKSESVSLKNCQIRRARQAEELEVVLRSSSGVELSPKKFTVGDIGRLVNSKMKLKDLNLRNTFDKVCVEAKVVRVDESVKVAGGISKQDVVIADSTSVAKITRWERDIGSVVEGKSYSFGQVVVSAYEVPFSA